MRLMSQQWFCMDFDDYLVTSPTILYPWEGVVDSQVSQPFSVVVVCTQTCYASAARMLYMLGYVTPVCNKCYLALLGLYLYELLSYVLMPCCKTHTCMLCVRVTRIAMCGI